MLASTADKRVVQQVYLRGVFWKSSFSDCDEYHRTFQRCNVAPDALATLSVRQ